MPGGLWASEMCSIADLCIGIWEWDVSLVETSESSQRIYGVADRRRREASLEFGIAVYAAQRLRMAARNVSL